MDTDRTITVWASEEEKREQDEIEMQLEWEAWAKSQERAHDWTQQKRIQNWEDAR